MSPSVHGLFQQRERSMNPVGLRWESLHYFLRHSSYPSSCRDWRCLRSTRSSCHSRHTPHRLACTSYMMATSDRNAGGAVDRYGRLLMKVACSIGYLKAKIGVGWCMMTLPWLTAEKAAPSQPPSHHVLPRYSPLVPVTDFLGQRDSSVSSPLCDRHAYSSFCGKRLYNVFRATSLQR